MERGGSQKKEKKGKEDKLRFQKSGQRLHAGCDLMNKIKQNKQEFDFEVPQSSKFHQTCFLCIKFLTLNSETNSKLPTFDINHKLPVANLLDWLYDAVTGKEAQKANNDQRLRVVFITTQPTDSFCLPPCIRLECSHNTSRTAGEKLFFTSLHLYLYCYLYLYLPLHAQGWKWNTPTTSVGQLVNQYFTRQPNVVLDFGSAWCIRLHQRTRGVLCLGGSYIAPYSCITPQLCYKQCLLCIVCVQSITFRIWLQDAQTVDTGIPVQID